MTTRLIHSFDSLNELRLAYMAFLKSGGLFIPCEPDFELGDRVELLYSLPGESDPIRVFGQVVWLNPQADSQRPPGVGIAFSPEDDPRREGIEQLLADQLGSGQLTWTL
ncbi:PilZ domain-containing protein [Ferrimonas futtsuensis]|uniref:PilZ domain-containing protein n=1 Tax=Ferrimonas futtsuensis TaxID=364764 RepID=UPI000400EF91|nr:PilZ domain-containing protein [Ferrimonas futtsuensis]